MAGLFYTLLAVLAVFSPGLCEKTFLQSAGVAFKDRPHTSELTVSYGGQWGNWTWPEMCPDNFFAVGFSVRVEHSQGPDLDDTALNGIRLFCSKDDSRDFMYTVESHTGYYGDWSEPQYCPTGVLTSFQLRVEPYQGPSADDTAANNIKFLCSTDPILEGNGTEWGEYGDWSQGCGKDGICGIDTKMEEYDPNGDNTSLNDVRFYCCAKSEQVRRRGAEIGSEAQTETAECLVHTKQV
ncbi:vitelline membrane outer layer protein 1 homolog [Myripristis murdjan]|uniref:vitelline membrane outer layer protein 1 homolog n=1 Tax=Myripristis murdjan TaxID=586833 RepID=UPI0011761A3E|nr:vitelline membrane outer layer protein 1 homolog [Myripristis murdjan]